MGKIITVWSPLAGAGKSILSIAISKILSGKLKDTGKVVIIDLDIEKVIILFTLSVMLYISLFIVFMVLGQA